MAKLPHGAAGREGEAARGQDQAQVEPRCGVLVGPGHAVLELDVHAAVKDGLQHVEALAHVVDCVKGRKAAHDVDVPGIECG